MITRQEGWTADNTVVVKTLEDALFVAGQTDALEVMVIGGGEIYKAYFEKAKRIYMTRVEATPDADTFFPVIEGKQWQLISQRNHEADEKKSLQLFFFPAMGKTGIVFNQQYMYSLPN